MRAEPCKQPRDRTPAAAGAARHHHDQILERIGRKHGRMDRELVISQRGLRRRFMRLTIVHERLTPCHVPTEPYTNGVGP
jgi:hypothetical protein